MIDIFFYTFFGLLYLLINMQMVINYCNQKKLDKEFMNDTFFGWLGKSVLGRFVLLFTAFPIVILTILFAFLVLIFKEKK